MLLLFLPATASNAYKNDSYVIAKCSSFSVNDGLDTIITTTTPRPPHADEAKRFGARRQQMPLM